MINLSLFILFFSLSIHHIIKSYFIFFSQGFYLSDQESTVTTSISRTIASFISDNNTDLEDTESGDIDEENNGNGNNGNNSSNRENSNGKLPQLESSENSDSEEEQCDEEEYVRTFLQREDVMTSTLLLFERCSAEDVSLFPVKIEQKTAPLPRKPEKQAFQLFCTALVRAHESNVRTRLDSIRSHDELIELTNKINSPEKDKKNGKNGKNEKNKGKESETEIELKLKLNKLKSSNLRRENQGEEDMSEISILYRKSLISQNLQDTLQRYIDELNLEGVCATVALGATVDSNHIRQASKYFGDEYFALFAYLLSCGEIYIADRYVRTYFRKHVCTYVHLHDFIQFAVLISPI